MGSCAGLPIEQILIGTAASNCGTYDGSVNCSDHPPGQSGQDTQCARILTPHSFVFMWCVASGYTGTDHIIVYKKNGAQWDLWGEGDTDSYAGYTWVAWDDPQISGPAEMKVTWFMDTRYFYVNWYYLVVHVQSVSGTAMSGITVYIDGVSAGTTDASGNVTILTGQGNRTITISSSITCSARGFDSWAPTQCSWTVNVTEDTTQNVTMCMTNECRTYEEQLFTDEIIYITCLGTEFDGGTQRWNLSRLCGGFNYTYNAYIQFAGISGSLGHFKISPPWLCPEPTPLYEEDIAANSWSSNYTHATYGTFRFKVGSIFTGGTPWAEIEQVCWDTRTDYGCSIDKSSVYVDCLNGNDSNSGLCSMSNAVKTITKAQSIIANNGTIYVAVGNCLNETLSQVLNPSVNTVHIRPYTVGNVVIGGT